ncbi:hypothetical protein DOY81_013130, partial [Sarcophaga bullata]
MIMHISLYIRSLEQHLIRNYNGNRYLQTDFYKQKIKEKIYFQQLLSV